MIETTEIQAVLDDPERRREVVTAAARALNVLSGPDPTVDGDDPAMVARVNLASAFVDDARIGAVES